MSKAPHHLTLAANEVHATEKEFQASMLLFQAALQRQDVASLKSAEAACHGALQRHLDSLADLTTVARKLSEQ